MKQTQNGQPRYRADIDESLCALFNKLESEKARRKYVTYSVYPLAKIKADIAATLRGLGVNIANPSELIIGEPPAHLDFDIAIPLFEYCKAAHRSPRALAMEVATRLNASKNPRIEFAFGADGYLNIVIEKKLFFTEVIANVVTLGDQYGESDLYKNKRVLIDYSSPNIAKPFGVGHLRSTVIGEALARIYHSVGFTVIRDNHLGDWGVQFGALMCAYLRWGNDRALSANPIEELKGLYVKFTSEAEGDPMLKEEARRLFARLEDGDPELEGLWNRFRDLSVREFDKTYGDLNIKFDIALGESYYSQGSDELIENLKGKGLAHDTGDGAVVVENLEGLPSFLIRKTDGSTLYMLRDVLTVIHRKQLFDPDLVLYVVGSEQELHFKQLFALCKAAGYLGSTDLRHVAFGLVLVENKKMSTRKGTVVSLREVVAHITEKVKTAVIEKGKLNREDVDAVARNLSISAVVYNDLKQNRQSSVEFDWEKMLKIESASAIYLQYTYSRMLSILSKSGEVSKAVPSAAGFEKPIEFQLALRLSLYPEVLLQVIRNDVPHLVSDFVEELASEVNRFYAEVNVLSTEGADLKWSRLCLLRALLCCMRNAMGVLNVGVVEKL